MTDMVDEEERSVGNISFYSKDCRTEQRKIHHSCICIYFNTVVLLKLVFARSK